MGWGRSLEGAHAPCAQELAPAALPIGQRGARTGLRTLFGPRGSCLPRNSNPAGAVFKRRAFPAAVRDAGPRKGLRPLDAAAGARRAGARRGAGRARGGALPRRARVDAARGRRRGGDRGRWVGGGCGVRSARARVCVCVCVGVGGWVGVGVRVCVRARVPMGCGACRLKLRCQNGVARASFIRQPGISAASAWTQCGRADDDAVVVAAGGWVRWRWRWVGVVWSARGLTRARV